MPRTKKKLPANLNKKLPRQVAVYLLKRRLLSQIVRDDYADLKASQRITIQTIRTFICILPQGRELLHRMLHQAGSISPGKKKKTAPFAVNLALLLCEIFLLKKPA